MQQQRLLQKKKIEQDATSHESGVQKHFPRLDAYRSV